MMSAPLIGYILKAASRDRLLYALVILIILSSCVSVFIGGSAVTESDQFVLVFASGSLRFAGVVGLVLFVVFHIRRSFETRDIEFLLSRPVSRPVYLFSHAFAYALLALFVFAGQAVAIWILSPKGFDQGIILWLFSLLIENIIMVSVAMFFALVLTSAAGAAMAAFAFYIFARMMGQILGIIDNSLQSSAMQVLEYIMLMISMVMPRLDLYGQTSWLVYGVEGGYGFLSITLQGIIFLILILVAALYDLSRRQF